ncbi:MAG: energy-coupling factor ABC transporter permease [Pseudomonadota bacterium]|nr:energy-coupling factor ABC transporter permease [Pseudomonadota bacterium]
MLSPLWLVLVWAIFLPLLGWSTLTVAWSDLRHSPVLNALPAFSVGLLMLWYLKAGLHAGLEVHLLGITAFTLMFGWRLTFIAVSAVLALLAANGRGDWAGLAANALLTGALPAAFSYLVYRLISRRLPRHFFVFVFLNGFFNAALTLAVTFFGISLFLSLTGLYPWETISHEFLILLPLLAFPEAFINGAVITLMITYYPDWVLSYDQREYLNR